MNQKRCHTLLPLVQLLPTVAAAAAVLFALPRTVPVLAAVPEKLTTVVEQPVEAASSEAEEETLPKLPYADGVYVGSSRGYGGAVRVQVIMENAFYSRNVFFRNKGFQSEWQFCYRITFRVEILH